MSKNKGWWLAVIIILAFGMRFYRLGSYPALNADEAAIGYNAYSLLETGKDEHGNSWPVHFQSFNDYKPGGYFYLVLPWVKVLGLTAWSVRIPGALMGVATVLVAYYLVKEIFNDEKHALWASFFLAISPWHIHFSRGGWEVNAATFLITLGLFVLIRSLKRGCEKLIWLAVVVMTASLYTYHTARVLVPLLGLGILVIMRRETRERIRGVLIAGMLATVMLIPLALELTEPEVVSRAAGVGLFADLGPFAKINEQRGEHDDFSGLVPKILHNKLVNYGLEFVENWGEHYGGEYLFLSGDEIQRNRVPETGEMYMVDFVFVMMAAYFIIRREKRWGAILWWLLIAPVGAALTFQSPHALRANNMVVPLTVISAYGCMQIIKKVEKVKEKRLRMVGYGLLAVVIGWSVVRYQRMYWLHMAKEYPYSSQYGVEELVDEVKIRGERFEKVIVTDRYDQPYIMFLFYLKYPPEIFQAEHALTARDQYGFSTVREFGKYRFYSINYDKVQPENHNSLIVGTDEEIPDEANVRAEIYGSNDYKYFQIVEN